MALKIRLIIDLSFMNFDIEYLISMLYYMSNLCGRSGFRMLVTGFRIVMEGIRFIYFAHRTLNPILTI